jgi:hypothetical protein
MKTKTLVSLLCAGGLTAALATAGFAGPSPQFAPQKKSVAQPVTVQAAPAIKAVAVAAMPTTTCAMCQTVPVTEFVPVNTSGKWAPQTRVIGTRHTCGGCAGAVVESRGNVRDTMIRTACATAGMKCCS